MASSSVSMAMPCASSSSILKKIQKPSSEQLSFFSPLSVKPSSSNRSSVSSANKKFAVSASLKEKAITGATAAALTASMVIPDVAQAAENFTPSLKNFLLSITSGGIVLVAIIGAVVGVSNFDPVKRV